jgi:hypothetical protein
MSIAQDIIIAAPNPYAALDRLAEEIAIREQVGLIDSVEYSELADTYRKLAQGVEDAERDYEDRYDYYDTNIELEHLGLDYWDIDSAERRAV